MLMTVLLEGVDDRGVIAVYKPAYRRNRHLCFSGNPVIRVPPGADHITQTIITQKARHRHLMVVAHLTNNGRRSAFGGQRYRPLTTAIRQADHSVLVLEHLHGLLWCWPCAYR